MPSSSVQSFALQQTRATVLGLEGPDSEASTALTSALRSAFAARGYGGGEELTLVELRLTMGCDTNEPSCLADGGSAMGADKLIYGQLLPAGGGHELRLYLLDVNTKTVEREVRRDLSAGVISDATARDAATRDIVSEMLPPDPAPVAPTAAPPQTIPADESSSRRPPPRQKDSEGLVWGRYSPVPRWKWIGLGVSAGLTAVALGTAIGTTVAIRPDGPLYQDLIDAAEDSLDPDDGSTSNNIDPNSDDDLCAEARAPASTPIGGDRDKTYVINKDVTLVCNRADAVAATATASWIMTGIFAASTAVFTTLLFVHRPAARAAARRGVRFGIGPRHDGGLIVGGGFKF